MSTDIWCVTGDKAPGPLRGGLPLSAPSDSQSSPVLELKTTRLKLVALDRDLARLQLVDRDGFFEALNVSREAAWPPEPFKADEVYDHISTHPDQQGWGAWVCLMELGASAQTRAVGLCGFQGPPDDAGEVALLYGLSPSFQEQGLATETVGVLLDWAFQDVRVKSVRADTPAYLISAQRVLEKTGFQSEGTSDRDGTQLICFRKLRD